MNSDFNNDYNGEDMYARSLTVDKLLSGNINESNGMSDGNGISGNNYSHNRNDIPGGFNNNNNYLSKDGPVSIPLNNNNSNSMNNLNKSLFSTNIINENSTNTNNNFNNNNNINITSNNNNHNNIQSVTNITKNNTDEAVTDKDVLKQTKIHGSETFRKVGPFTDSTKNAYGKKYSDIYIPTDKNNPKIGYYGKSRLVE